MTTRVAIVPQGLVSIGSASSNGSASASNTDDVQLLRLHHPRTGLPSLYCPQRSVGGSPAQLLEVQFVAADAERSWFIGNEVISDGRMLMFTPIDAIFPLIPILTIVFSSETRTGDVPHPSSQNSIQYRTADDIFEEAAARLTPSSEFLSSQESRPAHLSSPLHPPTRAARGKGREDRPITTADVITFGSLECVRSALGRICDSKEVGEDIYVYRFSEAKFLDVLRSKVDRLSDPKVLSLFQTLHRIVAKTGLLDDESSGASISGALDHIHGGKEDEAGTGASNEPGISKTLLISLARQKAAIDVLSQYLPPDLLASLNKTYDFNPLAKYLSSLEVSSATSADKPPEGFTTNSSTKTKGTSKKGKSAAGDETKKKGGRSRGVEQLKKADTKGMNKLSTFFTKK